MLSSSNITTWTQIEALNHSSLEPILIKQPLIMTAMKLIKESGFAPNFDSRITIDACKFNDLVGDLVKMHLKETSAVKTTIKPVIKETSAVKTTIKPVSKLAAPTKVPAFDDKKRPALKRPPILFKSGLGQVDSSK